MALDGNWLWKGLLGAAMVAGLSLCLPAARADENAVAVSVCDLARNPKGYDGKTIQVRGTLSVHFEDFTLQTGSCKSGQLIWLAFGGDVPGIVASTANDNVRRPGSDLTVNGVAYGIKKDESFRKLYALIASRHGDKADYRVTATLTGTFLAGDEGKTATGVARYSGYGHLGCCSLLVITRVSEVDSAPAAKLDVKGIVAGPDGKPVEGLTVMDDVLGGLTARAPDSGHGRARKICVFKFRSAAAN